MKKFEIKNLIEKEKSIKFEARPYILQRLVEQDSIKTEELLNLAMHYKPFFNIRDERCNPTELELKFEKLIEKEIEIFNNSYSNVKIDIVLDEDYNSGSVWISGPKYIKINILEN